MKNVKTAGLLALLVLIAAMEMNGQSIYNDIENGLDNETAAAKPLAQKIGYVAMVVGGLGLALLMLVGNGSVMEKVKSKAGMVAAGVILFGVIMAAWN